MKTSTNSFHLHQESFRLERINFVNGIKIDLRSVEILANRKPETDEDTQDPDIHNCGIVHRCNGHWNGWRETDKDPEKYDP